jgi:hypothetical protein
MRHPGSRLPAAHRDRGDPKRLRRVFGNFRHSLQTDPLPEVPGVTAPATASCTLFRMTTRQLLLKELQELDQQLKGNSERRVALMAGFIGLGTVAAPPELAILDDENAKLLKRQDVVRKELAALPKE